MKPAASQASEQAADRTYEPQYDRCIDVRDRHGLTQLGIMSNQTWHDDPKRLVFVLSRYKFVAKMLQGKRSVLEVGCADAFGTRIVRQFVPSLTASDVDPVFIEDVKRRMNPEWAFDAVVHDILAGPMAGPTVGTTGGSAGGFDAAYALDLLEHIPREREDTFVRNLAGSLTEHGVLILGSPSIHSQAYASPPSKAGHVNCKDAAELKQLMDRYFHNVFVFSMNDEVVHTGFSPMASYFFAIGCSVRRS